MPAPRPGVPDIFMTTKQELLVLLARLQASTGESGRSLEDRLVFAYFQPRQLLGVKLHNMSLVRTCAKSLIQEFDRTAAIEPKHADNHTDRNPDAILSHG